MAVTSTRARLSAGTLAQARTDHRPHYDRSSPPAITHIGLGAFARAHLGLYADDLLRLGHPTLIRGVSLHNPRAEEQLAPQDCLYSVTEQEPGAEPGLRVIGSVVSAATGPDAALRALTAPTTELVTLTITEKGYELDPRDREHPEQPASAPALLALSLLRRRATGLAPLVIAPLDNVAANGDLLRARVAEAAERLDAGLCRWVEDEVPIPNSVVDRMVPATTQRDLDGITQRLGLTDAAAVVTETHRSWVTSAVAAMEPWAEAGVELVPDTTPYEQRKLWLLNGPHSALAYCGLLAGHPTIARASVDEVLARFVRRLVDDVLDVARLPDALHPATFASDALQRFENPALGHTCAQVGADGSRKLPQRFAEVVMRRQQAHLDVTRFATVVAVWVAAVAGLALGGRRLDALEDPEAAALRNARDRGVDALVADALKGGFDRPFAAAVADALRQLVGEGMDLVEAQA